MESNTTEQDLSRAELLLDEPHFDEEATLLSARPVVPLEVVEAKSRSGRRWALAIAVGVALLIGAFGSTVIYRLRGVQQTTSVTGLNDPSSQNQPSIGSGVAAVESHEPVTQIPKPEDEHPVVENTPATQPPLISREPLPRAARKSIKSRTEDEGQDEALEEDIAEQRAFDKEIRRAERREERRAERREERRAERGEERRPRRVEKEAKHQSGDQDVRSTDDLLRIREIFEGRPKP